jgi:hypothetical protein
MTTTRCAFTGARGSALADVLWQRVRATPHDSEKWRSAALVRANSLRNAGKYAEAELLYRDVIERDRCILGDEHPTSL